MLQIFMILAYRMERLLLIAQLLLAGPMSLILAQNPIEPLAASKALIHHFKLRTLNIFCPEKPCNVSEARRLAKDLPIALVRGPSEANSEILINGNVIIYLDRHLTWSDELTPKWTTFGIGSHWYLIGSSKQIQRTKKQMPKTNINQNIYFVNLNTGSLTETYYLGDVEVGNKIGQIEKVSPGNTSLTFVEEKMGDSYLQRRSNLMGHEFRGITEVQVPYTGIAGEISLRQSKDNWLPTNNGVDLVKEIPRDLMYGLYFDVLFELEKVLNCSTTVLLRREKLTGSFGQKVNGSWTGILGSIERKDANIVVASVAQTEKRLKLLDFLQPFASETYTLYIPHQGFDLREWLAFLYPLKPDAWISLLLMTMLVLVGLKFCYMDGKSNLNYDSLGAMFTHTIGDAWMILMTYAGKKPEMTVKEISFAIRILMYFSCLGGMIVFMYYRASLTAGLSVQKLSVPFNSIEELVNSDIK